jgi:hypothetical protein
LYLGHRKQTCWCKYFWTNAKQMGTRA